ncbi:hypothetical protein RV07_GL001947 [Enterococcus malodoratus]|nr:hypothetical protein RV07_GL001947 [Enterococcus malodoratus]
MVVEWQTRTLEGRMSLARVGSNPIRRILNVPFSGMFFFL